MSHENVIRAWKDEDFRNRLSQEERSQLPDHPAGKLELTDAQLGSAAGGRKANTAAGDESCYSGIIACTLPIYCPIAQ